MIHKIKTGQIVYFYQSTGQYEGTIVQGTVIKAIKDLASNKVIYTVKFESNCWIFSGTKDLTAEYLYTSKKAIEKEYKEEIVYNKLHTRISELEKLMNRILLECAEPIKAASEGFTLKASEFSTNTISIEAENIMVKGVGNLKEEINKLKTEIAKIKKQIKPKTKKPVVKKETKE